MLVRLLWRCSITLSYELVVLFSLDTYLIKPTRSHLLWIFPCLNKKVVGIHYFIFVIFFKVSSTSTLLSHFIIPLFSPSRCIKTICFLSPPLLRYPYGVPRCNLPQTYNLILTHKLMQEYIFNLHCINNTL